MRTALITGITGREAFRTCQDFVAQDPRLMRLSEVDLLVADPSKAKRMRGWDLMAWFEAPIKVMVEADLARHLARD